MKTGSRSLAAFRVALGGLIASWVLFIVGMYQSPTGEGQIQWATYFYLAAVAAVGVSSVYAKRRAVRAMESQDRYSRSVRGHTIIAIIAAIIIAVWAVVVIFATLLFTDYTVVLERLLNTYVPIVLFTVLALFLLLRGFVFTPSAPRTPHTSHPLHTSTPPRTTALAYALPIIGGAVAAIVGGIIYDLTGTALDVWIWTLVVAIVGVGIVIGTHFSGKLPSPNPPSGLNLAWTALFSTVVLMMSFGYGSSAIWELDEYANVNLDVYEEGPTRFMVDVGANDLAPGSELVVTLTPGDETLASETTDRDGWAYQNFHLPQDLSDDTYELTAVGSTQEGTELTASVSIEVQDGRFEIVGESSDYADLENKREVSAQWIGSHVLPPFLMLVVVTIVLYSTAVLRSRPSEVGGEPSEVGGEL